MTPVRKTLRIYWQYTRRYRGWLVTIYLLLPSLILFEATLIPILIARALNRLAQANAQFSDFYLILVGVAAMELYGVIFWRVLVRLLWKLELGVMEHMANDVHEHLLSQSTRFHNNRFGGALVSQASKFVAAFERLADTITFSIAPLLFNYVFVVVILAFKVPVFAAILVVVTLLFSYLMIHFKAAERPYITAEAKADTTVTAQLADGITNFSTIKAFSNERLEMKLYQKATAARRANGLISMRLVMRNEIFLAFVSRSLNVLALLLSIIAVLRFHTPIGTLFLLMNYTNGLLRRLWDLSGIFKNLNRVFADAHEMTETLELQPEVADIENPQPCHIQRGDIRFHDMRYLYPEQANDDALFVDFNLHIKPGEKIGLVGHSGSGKTTLTKLILRLMDVTAGEILIDGQDIATLKQADLRSHIAYVPQEPLLFHRSLKENIRYGRLDASDEEVEIAARMAHATEFIERLPQGFDTLVGERGTKLSGGQRQRIAIARAMLKHAPILILDEATSALDSDSEQLIQDALWKLMEGRTAIIIAHRLSTIQQMDRIVVLEKGTIAEQGSHRELLSRPGIYAELWSHQSGGFLET